MKMRKLFLCLLLLVASPAFAQISHTSAGSTNGDDVTTSAISTTGADLITLVAVSDSAASTPVLTESTGNITFSACGSLRSATGPAVQVYYWAVTNVNQTSGSHTFTATRTSSYPVIFVQAWSGAQSSPCDTEVGTGSDSVTSLATGTLTPAENNELLITGVGVDGIRNMSVNGGFTELDEVTYTEGQHYGGSMGFLIQTTATNANPTWSTNGSASNLAVTVSAFKCTTCGGGGGGGGSAANNLLLLGVR